VVKDPPGKGKGNWAGAPSSFYDEEEGRFFLPYRLRKPLTEGRGYLTCVAESKDAREFNETWTGKAAKFDSPSNRKPTSPNFRKSAVGDPSFASASSPRGAISLSQKSGIESQNIFGSSVRSKSFSLPFVAFERFKIFSLKLFCCSLPNTIRRNIIDFPLPRRDSGWQILSTEIYQFSPS